jgi:serine/threonine protein kinase
VSLDTGTTLGHYQIVSKLGAGGMGEVYRALDTKLGRDVALKVLPPALANDPVRIDRFKREARVVASLNHPHIVTLYSVEESPSTGSGQAAVHFLTMELVEGETLDARVPSGGLAVAQVLDIAWAVADALTAAHAKNIVHRDLKPANVMITLDSRVKVLDFGLAKWSPGSSDPGSEDPGPLANSETIAQTGAGIVMGTVPYMSPEQIEGKPVDHRSDLFSLGAMLFELTAGHRPFEGSSPAALTSSILRDPAPELRTERPDAPPAFANLVGRCLEKSPDRRIQTAKEVRDEVDAIRRDVDSGRATAVAARPSSDAPKTVATDSGSALAEADRLTDEGTRALQFGSSGGSASRSNLEQARIYFKRALEFVPRHARALCQYGRLHYIMATFGVISAEEAETKGRELIMAALAADDQASTTHTALGQVNLYVDDDFDSAGRHIDRAVALDPGNSEALRVQSVVRKIEGRLDEAIVAARAAVAAASTPQHWNGLGDVLLAAGKNEDALDALRRAISLQAGYGTAMERMELALVRLGRSEEAVDFRVAQLRTSGRAERAELLQEEAGSLGPEAARRRDLQREVDQLLIEAGGSDPFDRSQTRTTADRLIITYCQLGDWTNAMTWVERWYANKPGRLRRVLMDLPIDRKGLATDPRYARLLRVAGLEGI